MAARVTSVAQALATEPAMLAVLAGLGPIPDCGTVGGTVQIGCTNGVTTAQSPFPNQFSVTVNEPVLSGAPFTADASGIGAFPKFFLDAAQGTVPGGVRQAVVEGFNVTVEPATEQAKSCSRLIPRASCQV